MIFGTPQMILDPSQTFYIWDGNPTGSTDKTISYSVTDSSTGTAVTATAQYKLTLHDEWEVKDEIPPADPQAAAQTVIGTWTPFSAWASNPIYTPSAPPATLHRTYGVSYDASTSQEFTKTVSKGASGKMDAGLDATVISPWLKAKGVTLGLTGTANIAVASEAVTKTANSQKLTYTVEPPIDIAAGEEARPIIQILAKKQQFKVWHFGEGGFLSEDIVTTYTQDETPFRPIWEKRNIVTTPPGNGGGNL